MVPKKILGALIVTAVLLCNIHAQPVLTYKTDTVSRAEVGLTTDSPRELDPETANNLLNAIMQLVAAQEVNAHTTSATAVQYAQKQEEHFRNSDDADRIIQELVITRNGLTLYRQLVTDGASTVTATKQAWDSLTTDQQEIMPFQAFQQIAETYASSKQTYQSLMARLPSSVDDIVAETQPRWHREGALQAFRDHLTSNTRLTDEEIQRAQAAENINVFYRDDPAKLLELKKTFIVETYCVYQFKLHGKFASPQLTEAFHRWWDERRSYFTKIFVVQ